MELLIAFITKLLGDSKMSPALIAGIIIAICVAAIPVSNYFLGANNIVAVDAEKVIDEEAPELLEDIDAAPIEKAPATG